MVDVDSAEIFIIGLVKINVLFEGDQSTQQSLDCFLSKRWHGMTTETLWSKTPLYCFLWGYLKGMVSINESPTIPELKKNSRSVSAANSTIFIPKHYKKNFARSIASYQQSCGRHLVHSYINFVFFFSVSCVCFHTIRPWDQTGSPLIFYAKNLRFISYIGGMPSYTKFHSRFISKAASSLICLRTG